MKRIFFKYAFAISALAAICAASQATIVQDATILIDRALNSPTLTVRYSGAAASLVELRVNRGSVATRDLNGQTKAGETTFTIDLSLLEDGDNKIEIILYDAAGKIVGRQTSTITADKSATSPIHLEIPRSGETVLGPVEIKVGLKREFRNPYISFFIDDEFKLLKNVPPYTYVWDTTRVANGWHEVQAWLVDDTNATYKTKKTRVFVNNPGGKTARQTSPEATPMPTKASVGTGKGSEKLVAKPPKASASISENSIKPVVGESAGIRTSGAGGTAATQNSGSVEPATSANLTTSVPGAGAAVGAAAGTKGTFASAGVASGPKFIVPNPANFASKPVKTLPINPVRSASAATNTAPIAIAKGIRLADRKSFTITYNSKIIEFDVQPRVENGVPLTPFRHLLEQSGGKVKWESELKKVFASSGETQIELTIGEFEAFVNSLPVKMELAPFIDSGRTIVPLSFIHDALKVKVDYDPATGHVLISTTDK